MKHRIIVAFLALGMGTAFAQEAGYVVNASRFDDPMAYADTDVHRHTKKEVQQSLETWQSDPIVLPKLSMELEVEPAEPEVSFVPVHYFPKAWNVEVVMNGETGIARVGIQDVTDSASFSDSPYTLIGLENSEIRFSSTENGVVVDVEIDGLLYSQTVARSVVRSGHVFVGMTAVDDQD